MSLGRIVVFIGSKSDQDFASRIKNFLEANQFPVPCQFIVASAHRTPKRVLTEIEQLEESEEPIVIITVAGLSDALSGMVAGSSRFPVIACPPDIEELVGVKFFSSAMTPKGVAVACVPKPENAALSAVKMLSLSDETLRSQLETFMREQGKSATA
jgi:5-(carboxyamino)imidazole ribonucleotide mutase